MNSHIIKKREIFLMFHELYVQTTEIKFHEFLYAVFLQVQKYSHLNSFGILNTYIHEHILCTYEYMEICICKKKHENRQFTK